MATPLGLGPLRNDGEFAARSSLAALVAILLLGGALRIWQYTGDTSLWLDEVALATGVVKTDLPSLLTAPLPYDQVAPKGFLLLQKLAVVALGPSDYALRLVPFACSLIALLAFAWLATRILEGVAPVAAVLLFATAAPFVSSSSLVKQYSVDVCVAVLLWCLAYELISRPLTTARATWAALVGSTLVWFSQPAVLIIASFGASFVVFPMVLSTSTKGRSRILLALLGCWGVSALAVTLSGCASMSPSTREYMHRFWAAGFPPRPLTRVFDTLWPWDRLMLLLGAGPGAQAGLAYPLPALYAALAAGGLGLLWRQNRSVGGLLMAPMAITLAAALARQYPFSDRLILFIVPALILGIAAAIEGLRRLAWPHSRAIGAATVAALIAPAAYPVAATPPVYLTEHMKPVLRHVKAKRQSGDGIYVYYAAAPVVTFYAAQYGLDRDAFSVGGCHRGDSRRYLQELDTFRGRSRVWLLLTHSLPLYREREDILAYLDTIGTRKDSLIVESRAVGREPLPAEVYLYDLSDARKASSGSASTYPLSGQASVDPRLGCGQGPQVMIRADFP